MTLAILAGEGFANNFVDKVEASGGSIFGDGGTPTGVAGGAFAAAVAVCTDLLKSAFDMATVGENSLRLISLQKRLENMAIRITTVLRRTSTRSIDLPRTDFWCSFIPTKYKKRKQTGEHTSTAMKKRVL